MWNDKKNIKAIRFTAIGVFFTLASPVLAIDSITDPSLLTPEIEQEIEEYSTGVMAENTFQEAFTETLPFFNDRFNQFEINLDKNSKKSYRAGERLKIFGSLKFFSATEAGYLDFKRNCLGDLTDKDKSRCLLSPAYLFKHYPETGIFVQVWQRDGDEQGALAGDYLIDEFFTVNGIDLKEGEEKAFSVDWKTLNDMKNGDYYLTFSVLNNRVFELFGTPLLAGAPKKIYDFKITDGTEQEVGAKINKNEIKINEKPYSYRAPAPEIAPSEEDNALKIKIPIVNGEKENKVSLRYELYKWGQTDSRNLLDSREESRVLKPKERFDALYKFSPGELESVYNLRVIAKTENGLSTSNIRFIIKNRSKAIFRFLALAQDRSGNYPFFCLKNTNWTGIFQGKVKMELKDSLGNIIHSTEQKANIRPETRCFIALEDKIESNECLSLKGKITDRNDKIVDEKEFVLPCGNEKESRVSKTLKKIENSISFKENKGPILIFVFILFILIGGFIYLNNKKRNNEN